MAQRSGIPTILTEAQSLQKHITDYTPTIQGLHPSNADLLSALADCAACLVNLISEVSKVRQKGD